MISAEDFDALSQCYLRQHPPDSYEFHRLGAHLAVFVANHTFARSYGVPQSVLAEIIAFEQAQLEASDQLEETSPVALSELIAVRNDEWNNLCVQFSASIRVLSCTHAVADVVEAVQRGAKARNAARIGRVEEVLVEGTSRTDESLLRGRTRRNTMVNFTGSAEPGDLVRVRIDSATSTTLRGAQDALIAV